jgi:hypothetical protein
MKKYVPKITIFFYLLTIVFFISSIFFIELLDKNYDTILIIVLSFFMSILLVLFCKLFCRQTYETKHGIFVWITKRGPPKKEVEDFIDFYIERLPEIWGFIKQKDIESAIRGCKIEFSERIFSFFGAGWKNVDKDGLQQGKNIKVKYNINGLERTLLAHDLHHMLDEVFFETKPDYEHKNVLWWYTVSVINAGWYQRNALQRGSLNVST